MDGAGEFLLTLAVSFVVSMLAMSIVTGILLMLGMAVKVILGAALLSCVVAFITSFLLIAKFAW